MFLSDGVCRLHTHIPRDADDGARTVEESILMLKDAAKTGACKKLVGANLERCSDVITDYRIIQIFVNNGVLIHLDAGSLTGLNGRRIKNTAETLITKGLAHMLASDVHRSNEVKGLLSEAFFCYTARRRPKGD
jgi:tyrosine-protein phosphatase YwqE